MARKMLVKISQGNGHQRAAQDSLFGDADTQVRPLPHFTLCDNLIQHANHILLHSCHHFGRHLPRPSGTAADIGEPELACSQSSIYFSSTKSHISLNYNFITHVADASADPSSFTNVEVKATLRRLSKMVLAGYGGASLLFFNESLLLEATC